MQMQRIREVNSLSLDQFYRYIVIKQNLRSTVFL
jgi:hypothetical protein